MHLRGRRRDGFWQCTIVAFIIGMVLGYLYGREVYGIVNYIDNDKELHEVLKTKCTLRWNGYRFMPLKEGGVKVTKDERRK